MANSMMPKGTMVLTMLIATPMAFGQAAGKEAVPVTIVDGKANSDDVGAFTLSHEGPAASKADDPITAMMLQEETTESTESVVTEESVNDREWPPGLFMAGLDAIGVGKPMNDLGIEIHGWVETSFTGILTGPGGSKAGLPLRVYEANKPDNLKMNQLALVIERAYDSSKDFDWGFRVDSIFGADSQVNASAGLLDQESHRHSFDLAQFYGQLWFGTGDDSGLELTIGKWYTTIGSEVIPATENWLPSRTMLFGFGPFSHVGVLGKYYFNSNFNIHAGVSRGWDQWNDENDGASFHAGFGWDSEETMGDDTRSSISFAYIGGPEGTGPGHPQNRHIFNVVWTYLWTEQLTQVVDTYFAWQDDVQDSINSDNEVRTRDSAWYGISYMLNYDFNEYLDATGRFEWFADQYGTRTGFQGNFFSLTSGLGITPFPKHRWLKDLLIRPELRWDFSSNNAPFNNNQQLTAALNLVYTF